MAQLAYQNTSLDSIAKALAKLNPAGTSESDQGKVSRSNTGNFIIVLPNAEQITSTARMVESVTTLRPGRFFVLCVDNTFKTIECQVALHCHLSSASSRVCSEVIRLCGSRHHLAALSSLVRAHVYAGVSTELLVVASRDRLEPLELIASLDGLADYFYFDSRKLCVEALARLLSLKGTLVDMAWLSSSAWRAQLKELFDRPALLEILAQTTTLEITEGSSQSITPGGLLRAWLMRCFATQGRSLEFKRSQDSQAGLKSLQFIDGAGKTVVLLRKEGDRIICEASQGVQLSRPLDAQDNVELLQRFFLIGESLVNYRPALCGALESICEGK